MRSLRLLLVMLCITAPCHAVDRLDRHALHLLTESGALELGTVVNAAAMRNRNPDALAGALAEAAAWSRQAELVFAAPPNVFLRHNRPGPGEDFGLMEHEALLQLTLKWPSQGDAQRRLATSARALALTDARAGLWQLAGIVREAIWEYQLALSELAAANRALGLSEQILETVRLRYQAGDLAHSELLLAEAEQLARAMAVTGAERRLADAGRRYESLTGLQQLPAAAAEDAVDMPPLEQHPALLAAADTVERARWSSEVQRQAGRTNPVLGIGPRRERARGFEPWSDSIGFTLQLPFGSADYATAAAASAERAVTDAMVGRERLQRELALARHEALHELEVARSLQAQVLRWQQVSEQREAIARVAFDAGEIDLTRFLRVRNDAIAARRARVDAELRINLAIARRNQAAGILPPGADLNGGTLP